MVEGYSRSVPVGTQCYSRAGCWGGYSGECTIRCCGGGLQQGVYTEHSRLTKSAAGRQDTPHINLGMSGEADSPTPGYENSFILHIMENIWNPS